MVIRYYDHFIMYVVVKELVAHYANVKSPETNNIFRLTTTDITKSRRSYNLKN